MAYYTFKAMNSALWMSVTLWNWGKWLLVGHPESPELILAKTNQERLDRMETKLDQIWALERGLPPVEWSECFVLVQPNQTTQYVAPAQVSFPSDEGDNRSSARVCVQDA